MGRLWPVRWVAAAFLLALVTRVWADALPAIRDHHLVYAGVVLTAGYLIWAWCLIPRVFEEEAEE